MLKMIKAELYKYSKRSFIYGIILTLSIGVIAVMMMLKNSGQYSSKQFALTMTGGCFGMILTLVMIFGCVLSEEYKDGTLKNLVSSKISKTKIYFSKFIVQIVLAIFAATICIIVLLVSISMLDNSDGYTKKFVLDFIMRFLASTPIFIAGIALVNFLIVLTRKEGVACLIYYFVFILGSKIIYLLSTMVSDKFKLLYKFLLESPLEYVQMPYASSKQLINAVVVGTIYTIIFTAITVILYRRQDVK